MTSCLNIFYEEPDNDRWFIFDRYPRRLIRYLLRGPQKAGGQMRVFLNLCAGLDKLGVIYRVNDYRYIQKHPSEVACIIGKPHLLNIIQWKNPILFGAAVYSHPIDDPNLCDRLPIRKVLVPGKWMREMFEPYYGNRVLDWPVGIDTDKWKRAPMEENKIDILLYDKIRWEHAYFDRELINSIKVCVNKRNLKMESIRYGYYEEEEFRVLLGRCKSMIFLCEHETQGIAYQQALSCGVPILAWDRGGYWQDPYYYPHKIKFKPVTSVPYWDDRCGVKFSNVDEFPTRLEEFLAKQKAGKFAPRDYILDNLTLEKCAKQYLAILEEVRSSF